MGTDDIRIVELNHNTFTCVLTEVSEAYTTLPVEPLGFEPRSYEESTAAIRVCACFYSCAEC